MLAAAGCMLRDHLDNAFAQGARRILGAPDSIVDSLDVELVIVDVHRLADAVAEGHDAVPGIQMHFAASVLFSVHDSDWETGRVGWRCLFEITRGATVD